MNSTSARTFVVYITNVVPIKGSFKRVILHNKWKLTISIFILVTITQIVLLHLTPTARGQNSDYRDHFEFLSQICFP